MEKACQATLQKLCLEIPQRPVGSDGNQRAVQFFQDLVSRWHWKVTSLPFQAIDWNENGADLSKGEERFVVFPSPYSIGVEVEAELAAAKTVKELRELDCREKLLLLTGELTQEQLMPKNFQFYNPEHHQQLISLIEEKQPAAILSATSRNASLAGGVYPFPLIEDGDFAIPSVFLTEDEGRHLAQYIGQKLNLHSRACRVPSRGEQLICTKAGRMKGRITISAHIDAKIGTPGAIDNATGVIVLLLLAERLAEYDGKPTIELVPFNGEDYYGANGQMVYLDHYRDNLEEIILNINLDGVGFFEGKSVFSPMSCPEEINQIVNHVIDQFPTVSLGKPWYQGDHSIFLQQGIPAVAVTSEWFLEHMDDQEITHTAKDHPEIVSCERVVEVALSLESLIRELAY